MIKKILGLSGRPNHFLWFYGIIILDCASNILMPIMMHAVGRWNDSTGRSLRFVESYRNQEKPNLTFWGENIPANNGFGFDGVLYAKLCMGFPDILVDHANVSSKKRRFVPSALAWGVIKVSPLSFENPYHIVLAFRIVNFVSLLLAVFFFIRICRLLKLSDITTWFAYIGLFVNYMVMKRAMYYPVDTGIVAFLCGFLLLYFYLKKSLLGLILTTVVTWYTWNSVTLFVLPLFLFPYNYSSSESVYLKHNKWLIIISFIFACCYLPIYLFYGVIYDEQAYFGDTNLVRSVIPLSLSIVLIYIYSGMYILLSHFKIKSGKAFCTKINIVSSLSFMILLVVYKISLKNMGLLSTQIFDKLHILSIRPMIQPAIFYIAHVVFFGPIIALVVLLWREIVDVARSMGLGLWFGMVFAFALSLNSESRHLTLAIVPVMFLVAKVLDKYKVTRNECVVFGVVSLLYSKVWMLMNIGSAASDNLLVMPWQRYFMSCGPWMSNTMYVVQGAIVAVTTVLLWVWIRKKRFNHGTH